MMYFLDTDILTLAHLGHDKVSSRIKMVRPDDIATTIITAVEILRGRQDAILKAADGAQLLRAQQFFNASNEMLSDLLIVPINQAIALEFDRLRNMKLRQIGRADLLIGSIALAHQAILVTRNVDHFHKIPGLKVENWAE